MLYIPLLFFIGYIISIVWLTLLLDYLLEKEELDKY